MARFKVEIVPPGINLGGPKRRIKAGDVVEHISTTKVGEEICVDNGKGILAWMPSRCLTPLDEEAKVLWKDSLKILMNKPVEK